MNIIIDTNVLVTALRSRHGTSNKLLLSLDDLSLKLHVSTPLVVEYEAILKRELPHLGDDAINAVVDYLCAIAEQHEIFYLWRPVLRDPGDDHILELAVKAQADIVTWNVRDFTQAKKFVLAVMTPKELLVKLGVSK